MYPYEIIFGLTLYDILISVGIVVALLLFSYLADKRGLKRKLQNLVFLCAVLAICAGWFFALLTQSIYNYLETGVFEWRGMTFYGGFVGGAAVFLAAYFIGGKIAFQKTDTPDYHLSEFFTVADIAVCCIAAAHALGRIGCLTAGCCHGKVYDEKHAFTVPLLTVSQSGNLLKTQYTVPVQLYEAVFLFALSAFLYVRAVKKKPFGLPLYLALYGVWRFFIEYARADDRGQTVVSFLSPSQLIAVVLVIASVAVFFIERRVRYTKKYAGGSEKEETKNECTKEE